MKISNITWQEIFEQPLVSYTNNEEAVPIKFTSSNQNIQIEDDATIVHCAGGKGYAIVDKDINNRSEESSFFEWKVLRIQYFYY